MTTDTPAPDPREALRIIDAAISSAKVLAFTQIALTKEDAQLLRAALVHVEEAVAAARAEGLKSCKDSNYRQGFSDAAALARVEAVPGSGLCPWGFPPEVCDGTKPHDKHEAAPGSGLDAYQKARAEGGPDPVLVAADALLDSMDRDRLAREAEAVPGSGLVCHCGVRCKACFNGYTCPERDWHKPCGAVPGSGLDEKAVRYGYQRGHADAQYQRGYREDLAATNWLTEWDEKAVLARLSSRPTEDDARE